MMNRKEIPVVPARGGAEVALDLMIKPLFSSIELACAVRRACALCANLLCCCFPRTWPPCDHVGTQHQANIFFTLHTALFKPCASRSTLKDLHFTLHSSAHLKSSDFFAPHVTSSDLFSSHPIPSHMSSKQVLLNCFHLIRGLKKVHLNSCQLSYTPAKRAKPRNIKRTKLLHAEAWDTGAFTQKILPKHSVYYKACTKYFPVLLRTKKHAQITSQYCFVLQSLHKVLNFTSVFADRTSFRAKWLPPRILKSQFYISFWRSNLISCEKVAFRGFSFHCPAP